MMTTRPRHPPPVAARRRWCARAHFASGRRSPTPPAPATACNRGELPVPPVWNRAGFRPGRGGKSARSRTPGGELGESAGIPALVRSGAPRGRTGRPQLGPPPNPPGGGAAQGLSGHGS
eukprot:scaffold975_cov398-Prasinococcus_capsulatus_cf.AAC.1